MFSRHVHAEGLAIEREQRIKARVRVLRHGSMLSPNDNNIKKE